MKTKKIKAFIAAAMSLALMFTSGSALIKSSGARTVNAAAESLPRFTEDFEGYEVNGQYIEKDTALTQKWDNNVFRGGDALGMDSHIYEIGKIEYENGTDGNKVLHLNNTTGQDTFFYMGPANDYRTKNFTAQFRLKFLADQVVERSWVGLSFRKRAASHYTGTNNLLFNVQRYKNSTQIAGHCYAIFDGGSANDLSELGSLYGDKLSLVRQTYTVPGAKANEDMPWITVRYEVEGNNYKIFVNDSQVADCTFDVATYDYYGWLSLNCCCANIFVDDFSVTVNDTELPPSIDPLPTPQPVLDTEKGKIVWEEVEGASLYKITYGDYEKTVFACEYSLAKLKPGTYDITVTALTEDAFLNKDSLPSAPIRYVVKGEEEDSTESADVPASVVSEPEKEESGCGCGSTILPLSLLPLVFGSAFIALKKKND